LTVPRRIASKAQIAEPFKKSSTPMTPSEPLQADQVLATLHELMQASASDTARIQAAKILLERLAPKEDDEATKRAAEERDIALAEARGLLAEFAALKLAMLRQPGAVDQASEAPADNPGG
jgi:hypothetical protein